MVLVGSDCCSGSVFLILLRSISSIELKNELILNYQKLKETFL